jgi:tetratricopeptide (TPR) repeat protein
MKLPIPRLRANVLGAISAPLGFYVLALLIVEVFIATVPFSSNLEADAVAGYVYLGVGMFVMVVVIVTCLVWFKPTHITFSESSHLQQSVSQLTERMDLDQKVEPFLRDAVFYSGQGKHLEAAMSFERALIYDPESEEVKLGLAVAKSFAFPEDLSEPLEILDEVIENNPNSAKAFYNRACIRCVDVDGPNHDQWIDDLGVAIELRPDYREYAKRDNDFEKYKDNPEFKELVSKKAR